MKLWQFQSMFTQVIKCYGCREISTAHLILKTWLYIFTGNLNFWNLGFNIPSDQHFSSHCAIYLCHWSVWGVFSHQSPLCVAMQLSTKTMSWLMEQDWFKAVPPNHVQQSLWHSSIFQVSMIQIHWGWATRVPELRAQATYVYAQKLQIPFTQFKC